MQIADRAMCVAPRARGTQMWHSVRGPLARGLQIVDPIIHVNVALRQGIDGSALGQSCKGLSTPETPKQAQGPGETSTLPPPMDLTPQSTSSSASAINETGSDATEGIKRKNIGASQNPTSKKGLYFSDND
ncbi:uncharacterized protein LOC124676064 isoform X1 [Lolium rigidum]|uniref:uncharacterized protein LOC124676064 isoform X1 n=2 Tax=Lolium rigidum TaxID=89674 RepID=UPI001F5C828A|nr:uncharacterized protein LOC124676064 isoform X1 [Lolium rigidum]